MKTWGEVQRADADVRLSTRHYHRGSSAGHWRWCGPRQPCLRRQRWDVAPQAPRRVNAPAPPDGEEMLESNGDRPQKHTTSIWRTRGGIPCFVCVGAASWPLERHAAAFRRGFTTISTLAGAFVPISPPARAASRRSTRGAAAGGRRSWRCSFNCSGIVTMHVYNVFRKVVCILLCAKRS